MTRRLSAVFAVLLIAVGPAFAERDGIPFARFDDYPSLNARSAVMIDAATGELLYSKNADLVIPPASLTKLMTIHLAYEAVSGGAVSLEAAVPIYAQDCAPDLPYRSSLMYLEAGMRVTLRELLQGLAIPSGNDAAFAVARLLSGSIEDFARDMNAEAESLGLSKTRFVEPSGLSENNATTAREFAEFCRIYVSEHPYAMRELHSLPALRFPLLQNMPIGYSGRERPIEQKNRNGLVLNYQGCDGLKTGYIDESGYNIALTAERAGTRLIAVILGGYGTSTSTGSSIREDNGRKLLDYGFEHFVTLRPRIVSMKPVRVWKGKRKSVELEPGEMLALTARRDEASSILCATERDKETVAPILKGQKMGELVFSASGKIVKRIPLVAKEEVKASNPLARLWDSIILFFRGGVKRA